MLEVGLSLIQYLIKCCAEVTGHNQSKVGTVIKQNEMSTKM